MKKKNTLWFLSLLLCMHTPPVHPAHPEGFHVETKIDHQKNPPEHEGQTPPKPNLFLHTKPNRDRTTKTLTRSPKPEEKPLQTTTPDNPQATNPDSTDTTSLTKQEISALKILLKSHFDRQENHPNERTTHTLTPKMQQELKAINEMEKRTLETLIKKRILGEKLTENEQFLSNFIKTTRSELIEAILKGDDTATAKAQEAFKRACDELTQLEIYGASAFVGDLITTRIQDSLETSKFKSSAGTSPKTQELYTIWETQRAELEKKFEDNISSVTLEEVRAFRKLTIDLELSIKESRRLLDEAKKKERINAIKTQINKALVTFEAQVNNALKESKFSSIEDTDLQVQNLYNTWKRQKDNANLSIDDAVNLRALTENLVKAIKKSKHSKTAKSNWKKLQTFDAQLKKAQDKEKKLQAQKQSLTINAEINKISNPDTVTNNQNPRLLKTSGWFADKKLKTFKAQLKKLEQQYQKARVQSLTIEAEINKILNPTPDLSNYPSESEA